ncbi:MAG TPA: Rid family hydrolase [Holophagaceae bacterium]|nr:Rid family hydrolase [Holophagaceae bacterium]
MILHGYLVPGKPLPLLAPDKNPAWAELRKGFEAARDEIKASGTDLILLYSTQWINVIGHQIQADPQPEWVHVDQDFHAFGTMPYRFRMDPDFAKAYEAAARERGLHARTVSYTGFPLDSGVIQALRLLDPDNAIPACVVGCNMYADRAETLVLGKAAAEAVARTGRKAVVVAVSALSNRVFPRQIEPQDDHLYAAKDDEWNRKLLEMLGEGRLEDVSQVARDFAAQAHGEQRGKAFWWLAAAMGQHNGYDGKVFAYGPLWGSGGAVVGLTPNPAKDRSREFDEGDVQTFTGDRSVLSSGTAEPGARDQEPAAPATGQPPTSHRAVSTDAAPRPVGAYPHARREGDLLFLSGIGPRQAGTDEIPGGPIRMADGTPRDYDAAAQTKAVIENIRTILEAAGSSLAKVVDCQCFLVDMARDFKAFNEVYASYFKDIQATRTTVEVRALPTPIAVEMKVIARV